jgi:hypothetical protein
MNTIAGLILFLVTSFCSFGQGVRMPVYADTLFTITHINKLPVNTVSSSIPVYSIPAIPADLYTQHLGFFCRQELKMQQVNVPVTFRVGSMDQCNYLEQKPGYKN